MARQQKIIAGVVDDSRKLLSFFHKAVRETASKMTRDDNDMSVKTIKDFVWLREFFGSELNRNVICHPHSWNSRSTNIFASATRQSEK